MLTTCEYEGRLTDILTRAFSQVETVRSSALFFPSVGSLRNALSSNGADPRKVTGDPGSREDPGYRRSICDAERRAYHDRTWVPDRESEQRNGQDGQRDHKRFLPASRGVPYRC